MDWLTEQQKIASFIQKTGAGAGVAKQQLKEHSWRVSEAVKSYKFLKHAVMPPLGPQKNAEQEKQLRRGISKTVENEVIIDQARRIVMEDLAEDLTQGYIRHLQCTAEYSFRLPCTEGYADELRSHLHKELIDSCHIASLEQAGHLNWWAERGTAQRLWPLQTKGDGNCLLHAASLGMWGFHDRELLLRNALNTTVANCTRDTAMWRRWRWEKTIDNKLTGLELSETEWTKEWDELLKLSSPIPRGTDENHLQTNPFPVKQQRLSTELYDSLEEFHVFVLAQVLRRPIIVVSDVILKDSWGNAMSPVNFGGIYLPIECEPDLCTRTPLLLTYDASHFSALVRMETTEPSALPCAIPLVDPQLKLLRMHYIVDPGPDFVWGTDDLDEVKMKTLELSTKDKLDLLETYMDLREYTDPTNSVGLGQLSTQESLQRSNSVTGRSSSRLSNSSDGSSNKKSLTLDGKSDPKTLKHMDSTESKRKLKQQVQTLTKSFNSLGRSVGKKIRKISGKGKDKNGHSVVDSNIIAGKDLLARKPDTHMNGVLSLDSLPSATVLCVDLRGKRLEYQDMMMSNYLSKVLSSFSDNNAHLHETISEEGLDTTDHGGAGDSGKCDSDGCTNIGQPSKMNLCQSCYQVARQRLTANLSTTAPLAKGEDVSLVTATQNGCLEETQELNVRSHPPKGIMRQDTLITQGKSKFYTISDEEHSLPASVEIVTCKPPSGKNNMLASGTKMNNDIVVHNTNRKTEPGVAYALGHSSFYLETPSEELAQLSSAGPSKDVIKPILVNNLQNEYVYHRREDVKDASYDKPAPFSKQAGKSSKNEAPLNTMKTKLVVKCPDDIAKGQTKDKPPSLSNLKTKNHFNYDSSREKCLELDCKFFGSPATDYYCSACFKLRQNSDEQAMKLVANGTIQFTPFV